jgi:hypothetical protein
MNQHTNRNVKWIDLAAEFLKGTNADRASWNLESLSDRDIIIKMENQAFVVCKPLANSLSRKLPTGQISER